MPELRRFLKEVSLPLKPDYVDLAFRYLENSYTVPDMRLRFLSLMIALEILLNADRNELWYRVSRNLTVLIGRDEAHAARIFKEARALYDIRSKLVHAGHDVDVTEKSLGDLETLVRGAFVRLSALGLEKDELLSRLNASGFGSFWRTTREHPRSRALKRN